MRRMPLPVALAGGFAAGALTIGVLSDISEIREAYPEGMVCFTHLPSGYDLGELAENSAFRLDADGVLQRSQFLDPKVFLSETSGKLDYSYAGDPFNVMPSSDIAGNFTGEGYVNHYNSSDCEIVDRSRREVVSSFPSTEAARKILKATVAVAETGQEDGNIPDSKRPRRCGAIALGPEMLVMPSDDTAWDSYRCGTLKVGEAENTELEIMSEAQGDQWRFVHVAAEDLSALEPVEIDDGYQPVPGDVVVYSGYSRDGSREYFRMRVLGVNEYGNLLLEANVDQTTPYNEDYYGEEHYRVMHYGGGGIFTMEGKLIGMTVNTTWRQKPEYYHSDEGAQQIAAHNKWVEDRAAMYGVELESVYGPDFDEHEQLVMVQRITHSNLRAALAQS